MAISSSDFTRLVPLLLFLIATAVPSLAQPQRRLAKGFVVTGELKAVHSGSGLTGAVAMDWTAPLDDRRRHVVSASQETDATGLFRFEIEAEPDQGVTVLARAPDYISSRRRVTLSSPTVQVDFQLSPAVPLSGILTDFAGRPIEGANVRVVYLDEEEPSGIGTEMGEVATDAFGRLALPYVKAYGRFLFEITKEGYVPAFSAAIVNNGKALEVLSVAIDLKKGVTLDGVVLDQSGNPVAGAVVRMRRPDTAILEDLQRRSTAAWEMKEKTTETSADGRFQFSGLTGGPVSITVSTYTREFQPQTLTYDIDADENALTTIVLVRR